MLTDGWESGFLIGCSSWGRGVLKKPSMVVAVACLRWGLGMGWFEKDAGDRVFLSIE